MNTTDKISLISLIIAAIAAIGTIVALIKMDRQNRKSNNYTTSQETIQLLENTNALLEKTIGTKNEEIIGLNNRINSLENTRSEKEALSKQQLELKDTEIEKLVEQLVEIKTEIVSNLKVMNDRNQIREEELKNVEVEAKKIAINESDKNEIDILVKKVERIQDVSKYISVAALQTLYKSHFKIGQYHLAAESIKRLIEKGYNTADNYFKMGLCYNHAGDIISAVKNYEIATEKDKSHPIYWSYYGGALKKLGRYDEAIEKLNIAIDLDNRCDDAYYNLGAIYAMKIDLEKAIYNLKKAIDLKPETRDYIVRRPYFDKIKNHPDYIALVGSS
jgi:tetratricopeptide (TPR) repeat protein